MRDVLEPEHAVAERIEQFAQPPDRLQAAGRDAFLALALLAHVGRGRLQRVRLLAVGDFVTLRRDQHRADEIVEQRVFGQCLPQSAPHGEQFARGSDRRIEPVVQLLEFRFVFPVDAFGGGGSRSACVGHALLARHAPDLRVLETADDLRHGFGIEHRVGVGEDHERRADVFQRAVQRRGLAAAPCVVQNGRVGVGRQQFDRPVGRAVGDPRYAEFAGGILQRAAVGHLFGHDLLFVVGGDQQRHFGRLGRNFVPARRAQGFADFHQRPQQDAVAEVGVEDEENPRPEEYGYGRHASKSSVNTCFICLSHERVPSTDARICAGVRFTPSQKRTRAVMSSGVSSAGAFIT